MMVTMIDVISINGKITSGDESHDTTWASSEDFRHFKKVVADHRILIMGRKTYEAVLPKPQPGTLRIVVTRTPGSYASLEATGMLEFSDLSPSDLLAELRRSRHDYDVLLLGGGELNTAFLEAGLVDRILITIEPVLFAGGTGLLAAGSADIRCNLLSVTQLNERGTLLVAYAVDKS